MIDIYSPSMASAAPASASAQLSKHFQAPTLKAGLKTSVCSLVRRTYRTVVAVDQVSFAIQPSDVVGFLGTNEAGKITTLKMLSGLLHPSGVALQVLGFKPYRCAREFLGQITLVLGNRNQLNWDPPALESFEQHSTMIKNTPYFLQCYNRGQTYPNGEAAYYSQGYRLSPFRVLL